MAARRPAWWGGVVGLCMGALAWWGLGGGSGLALGDVLPPAPAVMPTAVDGASPAAAPGAASAAVRPIAVTAPASAAAAAVVPPATATAQPRDGERTEVCGHGNLLPQDFERLYPQQVLWDQRQRLNDQLLRGDARQQAVGWLLSQALVVDRATGGSGCGGDAACVQRITPQIERATTALVDLAVNRPDPWLYALAASYGCSYGLTDSPAASACARLSPADWQRRAPDDAAPWLWQADLAGRRRDRAAVLAALKRAGEQRTFTSPSNQLLATLQGFAPWHDADPVLRMTVLSIVKRASVPLEGTASTGDCELGPPGGPEQDAACDAAMRLFSSDGATLVHHEVAADIARQRGEPAERVQTMEDFDFAARTRDKVVAVQNEGMSCAAIDFSEKHVAAVIAHGELGALRRALRDSGSPGDERARMPRVQHPQQRAAAGSPPN